MFTTFHRATALTLLALSLTACSVEAERSTEPTVYKLCAVDRSAGWQLSSIAPANRSALLELESDGKPVHERLNFSTLLQEAWFAKSPDHIRVCRYLDVEDSCQSLAATVEFTQSANGWSAGPAKEFVCVADSRAVFRRR
jgi:hypothetical protein